MLIMCARRTSFTPDLLYPYVCLRAFFYFERLPSGFVLKSFLRPSNMYIILATVLLYTLASDDQCLLEGLDSPRQLPHRLPTQNRFDSTSNYTQCKSYETCSNSWLLYRILDLLLLTHVLA